MKSSSKLQRDRKFNEEINLAATRAKAKELRNLDYKQTKNRKFLVSAFRELEKIVNKNYKYCSEVTEEEEKGEINLVDLIINKSKMVEPYMAGNFDPEPGIGADYQRVSMSRMDLACRMANRECYEPRIKVDGELVFEYQNPNMSRLKKQYEVYSCFKNSSFLLSIELEPNCTICFTKNGKNPLLANQNEVFRCYKSFEEKMVPPCVICIVAVSDYFRLPSRVLTVVVKKSSNGNEDKTMKKTGMIRPDWLNYDDLAQSRSNYSNISNWS